MNRGKVYSVSSVNQYIKNMFSREYALSVVFVKGEISNCKYHSSGHIYFSLKDETSQLTCVMFRGDRRGLDFRMENGQEVIDFISAQICFLDMVFPLLVRKISPEAIFLRLAYFRSLRHSLVGSRIVRIFPFKETSALPAFAASTVI